MWSLHHLREHQMEISQRSYFFLDTFTYEQLHFKEQVSEWLWGYNVAHEQKLGFGDTINN